MEQISLDGKVDYKRIYKGHIKKGKISGDNLVGLCPFHDDKKPSFGANLKTGVYNCLACGEKGNAITFLSKIQNIDHKEAYKILLKEAGLYEEQTRKQKPIKYTVDDYCKEKKLDVGYIRSLGVRDGRTGITIPYMDEGGKVISNRPCFSKAS